MRGSSGRFTREPTCGTRGSPARVIRRSLTRRRPLPIFAPLDSRRASTRGGPTMRHRTRRHSAWAKVGALVGMVLLSGRWTAAAQGAEPIKIGFGMALTGGLAANGKAALIAMQLWAEDVNKKGGILGRPVELVYYDDQTKGATVPGIYTKLLDVDKVNFVVSGYGTNLIAPAMPIVIERKLVFPGLFGLANNEKYNYAGYFQIMPAGPRPAVDWTATYFEVAARQTPKPQTVALVGADAEYPHNALAGARENVKRLGFKVVYDSTYPPNTVDFTPIVRAIKALDPYLPPWAYAYLQVLGQAIEATKSLDQQIVADYIRKAEFDTIVGKVRFGSNGEWLQSRVLQVQFQGIETTDIEQFKQPGKRVVLYPEKFKSGTLIYPYSKAKIQ